MKKFLLMVAVAAVALLADSQLASAGRRGGCGGGRHGGSSCGGCGGYQGGCGMSCGGCGMSCGGCGMSQGGCGGCGMGGGYVMGGCQSCGGCGTGGYVMGGCANGLCSINGNSALAMGLTTEATLVVNLPADATLTIDNQATLSTTANRVFVTPALEVGKEYQYTLKAQVTREGKVQTATAQVTLRPGEVSQVELKIPATSVAAQ